MYNVTIHSATDHITYSAPFDNRDAARRELASRGYSFRQEFDFANGVSGESWHKPSTATEVGSRGVIKPI